MIKPYVYEHDPRLKNITPGTNLAVDEKVEKAISQNLSVVWVSKINNLYDDLKQKHCAAAYLVTAKDDQQRTLGFALLEEKSRSVL